MSGANVIKDWDAFELLAVPLNGAAPLKSAKKGRPVSIGEHLARHPGPLKGDVHSPANGLVVEVNEREIVIRRSEEAIGKTPAPADLSGLSPVELAQALKYLGLDIPEVYPGDPFIVQAFDAEPGLSSAPALFSEQRETVLAGLEALEALYPEHPVVWAVTDPSTVPENAAYKQLDAPYPYSLPALVKPRIIGRRTAVLSGVFSGRDLYLIGRVWRTGLPLTRVPLTLGQANYLVPLGARIIDLLTFANLRPGPNDSVIKGGLVRGLSLSRLGRGVGKKDEALHLVKGSRRRARYFSCRSCGECSRACPAGIDVARAGRLSPEQWLDNTSKNFEGCFQCGACALACPSRRPLLSLARLSSQ